MIADSGPDASRIKLGMIVGTLGFDARRNGVLHLTSLQHPAPLGICNDGYDDRHTIVV